MRKIIIVLCLLLLTAGLLNAQSGCYDRLMREGIALFDAGQYREAEPLA